MVSVTVMVRDSVSVSPESSVATTPNVKAPGPCISVGVHVNVPVAESMAAPEGAPVRW